MQDIKAYEEKAEVLIKATVTGRVLTSEGVRYILTDPRTNLEYKYLYSPDEVYPVPEKPKVAAKVTVKAPTKTTAKKDVTKK